MKCFLTEFLVCPNCLPHEVSLQLSAARVHGDDIQTGSFACPRCSCRYPVSDGIADLTAPSAAASARIASRYESAETVSSYLWSHFADLAGDADATTAYSQWAALLPPADGIALDAGCAAGRLAFELTAKYDFVIGVDLSHTFVRNALELSRNRRLSFSVPVEGELRRELTFEFPSAWIPEKVDFIVADVQCLPFRRNTFSHSASLNIVDKVPRPLAHLVELNRVTREDHARILFSDPFSWSYEVSKADDWLGGLDEGPFAGYGIDNVAWLLEGKRGIVHPPWTIEERGSVWWKIRAHANRFELIRSQYIEAFR